MSLAATHPGEVFDRVRTKLEDLVDQVTSKPFTGETISWEEAVERMVDARPERDGVDARAVDTILNEAELSALEVDLRRKIRGLASGGPFRTSHNADFGLARLCYLACRLFHPAVVVETGVCYGVTSSFILTALTKNGAGILHSVDLPPLADNGPAFVGALVPEEVRERWRLHRGPVRRILPKLLASLGEVNMFVHDSLHTYATMSFEFKLVGRHLGPRSVVFADDVGGNMAFPAWLKNAKPEFSAIVRERDKDSAFGVSLLP